MKFIAKFRRHYIQTTDIEIEAENEEQANAILNEDDDNFPWYEAIAKMSTESKPTPTYIEVVEVVEKSVYEDRKRRKEEEEKLLPF